MNIKAILYVIFLFLSAYSISGINFEKFLKKNRIIEANILLIILSFIFSYLLTNWVIDFLEVSKIIK